MALQLLILATDGVLIAPSKPGVLQPIPAALEAVARLTHAGYHLVATSAIAIDGSPDAMIDQLNRRQVALQQAVSEVGGTIDAFFFCPHGVRRACQCRPPRPGLYLQIAERWRIPLDQVPCVAASTSELAAAVTAGGRPVAIGDYPAQQPSPAALPPDTEMYADLATFTDRLLATAGHE